MVACLFEENPIDVLLPGGAINRLRTLQGAGSRESKQGARS
jgi:hypothetical protein